MIFGFSDQFKKSYKRLPADVRQRVDKAVQFLAANPAHPSLQNKKIQGAEGIWEIRVTKNYRITYEKLSDGYFLRRVGTHDVLNHP